jgi:hypothetical protein
MPDQNGPWVGVIIFGLKIPCVNKILTDVTVGNDDTASCLFLEVRLTNIQYTSKPQ